MGLSKTSLKQILLTVVLAGFAIGSAFIFQHIFNRPVQSGWVPPTIITTTASTATTPVYTQEMEFGLPVRLKIPKINVDADIEYAGITPKGELGVPKGPTNAGWYNLGPRPGEVGSAVIDGHFGYKDGIEAVFDNLNKLQKGDNVYIFDEQGKIITFVVSELRIYGQNDDSTSVFISNDGKAHLNLITCQGEWNKTLKSYTNRLVVFSDKEIQ